MNFAVLCQVGLIFDSVYVASFFFLLPQIHYRLSLCLLYDTL
ncbi:BgTH12-07012 [Blumeria graminis f. sp. triticale]|uniref:BgTH12-07012 n=1 Tax=Blumeria graminis f. sp. triticale TaxID=1689686 RepID=A0A9W4DSY6_BLUGR|nr:BgTH12-07012 [Blumeria graminis f. sp. triticale]